MPGNYTHSPEEVIQQLLIDQSLATDPSDGSAWPARIGSESASPNNHITCYGDTGRKDGRDMFGEVAGLDGVQIQVRSLGYSAGSAKIQAIQNYVDSVVRVTVSISSSSYLINSITRNTNYFRLGKQEGSSLQLFSLNLLVSMRQTT